MSNPTAKDKAGVTGFIIVIRDRKTKHIDTLTAGPSEYLRMS